jgi:hypothetical protein
VSGQDGTKKVVAQMKNSDYTSATTELATLAMKLPNGQKS